MCKGHKFLYVLYCTGLAKADTDWISMGKGAEFMCGCCLKLLEYCPRLVEYTDRVFTLHLEYIWRLLRMLLGGVRKKKDYQGSMPFSKPLPQAGSLG